MPRQIQQYNLFAKATGIVFLSCCFIYSAGESIATHPTNSSAVNTETESSNETNADKGIPQDLYVIKTVVYEIGILTDVGNDTTNRANETREQVDVSFFDSKHNGSLIDFANIPVPIQTNISGVSVTGLVPAVDLASLIAPGGSVNGTSYAATLPNKQVTVTQNISTADPHRGSQLISNLPQILGLTGASNNSSVPV